MSKGKYRSNTCYALLDAVIDSTGSQSSGKMTMYDSRLFSKVGGFYPPGHQDVEVSEYLVIDLLLLIVLRSSYFILVINYFLVFLIRNI